MPDFQFNARDNRGTAQSGVIQANSAAAVVDQLRSRGWLVTGVREKVERGQINFSLLSRVPLFGPRNVHVELALQQIAVMLRGGLSLLSSLQTVAEQSPRAAMRLVWRKVIDDIQEGTTFSEALSRHSCFPTYVVRLSRVGEQTGILESVLTRGAKMMQSRREAKRDMLTALAYPLFVMLAAFGVTGYMVGFLIPKLGKLLESLGKELPAMTQMLVDTAYFVQDYGLMILIGLSAAIIGFVLFYLWEPGRLAVDRFVLRIPLVGKILRVGGTLTFAQSLSILLRSGITVLDALVTMEQMHYNRHLAVCLRDAREKIIKGSSLAQALPRRGGYMPLLATMTAVGEESGNLDEVMEEVTRFHQSQMQTVIRMLGAWVTPVVTVVVGSIVGFVYIAFFMALFAVGA